MALGVAVALASERPSIRKVTRTDARDTPSEGSATGPAPIPEGSGVKLLGETEPLAVYERVPENDAFTVKLDVDDAVKVLNAVTDIVYVLLGEAP